MFHIFYLSGSLVVTLTVFLRRLDLKHSDQLDFPVPQINFVCFLIKTELTGERQDVIAQQGSISI